MRLGAHMSIAGGVDNAFTDGIKAGCDTIQIFTKSSNQWKARPLGDEEIARFKKNQTESGISPVVAHDSYLINLCAPDSEKQKMSVESFAVELSRCRTLGIPFLVMHPGSHLGEGEEWGLKIIAKNISSLLEEDKGDGGAMVLLETTAGQGSNLGYKFEQLRFIMDLIPYKDRIGVCLDTAHIFAAGYDIKAPGGFDKVLDEFERVIGIKNLKAVHLNDSKKACGSRVDRHEMIGKGEIGIEPFRYLMNKKELASVPMILETPKDKDYTEDIENLALLRSLIK
jgi:deoxyribonuclease-4